MGMRTLYTILALALLTGAIAMAAQTQQSQAGQQSMPPNMAQCQQMAGQRAEMVQRMEAMEKKINDLVVEMNQSKGDRRIEAMAKIITEMATQHKDMRQAMMQANEGMTSAAMCQMMQGMTQGMMQGMMNMRGGMMNNAPNGTSPSNK